MNLLIMDDEYYVVQGIQKCLSATSLPIDCCYASYSAEQAREIMKRHDIDILLADIEMPYEDGLSFIRWLRQNGYGCRVVILTSHQRFDYCYTAFELDCDGYLLKPVQRAKLEAALQKLIGKTSGEGLRDRGIAEDPALTALPARESSTGCSTGDNFMDSIKSIIMKNLTSHELGREFIAEELHLNSDYLSSLFHQKFGQTLTSYILSLRIDRAKEFLQSTDLSVQEISERVGFVNQTYFFRQFKKECGMTPQQFRDQFDTIAVPGNG